MLRDAGFRIDAIPALIDEEKEKHRLSASGAKPAEIALGLAELKALMVGAKNPEKVTLGADQLLVCDGKFYAKARNSEDAKQILRELAGKKHELVTAAVLVQNRRILWRHVESPSLWMRKLDEDDIGAYARAAGSALLDCVGGYRIEEAGRALFGRIDGDEFTIQGLPLSATCSALKRLGIRPSA